MTCLSIVPEILTIIHRAVWTLHEQEHLVVAVKNNHRSLVSQSNKLGAEV
jgi:hypothetical protein